MAYSIGGYNATGQIKSSIGGYNPYVDEKKEKVEQVKTPSINGYGVEGKPQSSISVSTPISTPTYTTTTSEKKTPAVQTPTPATTPVVPEIQAFKSNMSNISKADPNAIANAGYVNALYQEKFQRNATQAELDKFTTNTVKDASNLILGQDMSPFRDVLNTDIGNTPTQIDPNAGADNLVDGLVKDDVVVDEEAQKIGYQAEIDKINAENEKALADKQAIIDEKKAIEEARLEADRANLEAGIEKRNLTQDEINADKELIEKENYFDSLSTINESISSAITDKAAFEAKMKAERGDNYRSIPSVKRVLDNYDEMIASSQILKSNLTTGFNNASIAVDNYYSSKMATIDSNEATYKTLYDLDNANVITLTAEEKENLDAQKAIAEEEKAKLQEKQDTIVSLLEDGNINERAFRDYGLSLDDEPEEMMLKVNKAAQDQVTINSLISKYPAVNITSNMSLDEARELIKNSTGDDIQIITQGDNVYSYNKSTGELIQLLDEEDSANYEIDGNGNLVKVKERSADESKALGFADRMDGSYSIIYGLWDELTSAEKATAFSKVPNAVKSDKVQQFEQAGRNFINAQLRRESGAAIADSEFENANKTFLPRFGDKDGTLKQKQSSAVGLVDAMYEQAGGRNEIVEISSKQRVADFILGGDENKEIVKNLKEQGIVTFDGIAEALGLYEVENGSGVDLKTYETGTKAGQCGVYINKTAGIRVGNNKQDKINNVDKYGSKGTSGIKEGDVIVQNIGTYGHVALVTSVNPDGTVTLSESNYKNDEKVTNNRKISLNDSSIYGYLRPSNQTSNTLLI